MNNHEQSISELYEHLGELKRMMMRTRDQMLGEHQLTRTQVEVMAALRHNGDQTIGEVADYLGVTHSASTQTVETMVKRGLVERFNDATDRRIVRIKLTSEGIVLADTLYQSHLGHMKAVFSDLSEDELRVMITVLSRLTRQFNNNPAPKGGE
ncbi:MarR family transcriptional regulator [Candidatus Saccharibacteria bacterium]|nr:MarR family transcriptional regulator [Candidatus Saccharibacteria bacterium]